MFSDLNMNSSYFDANSLLQIPVKKKHVFIQGLVSRAAEYEIGVSTSY